MPAISSASSIAFLIEVHSGLEVDDDAALDPARLGDADADDVEAAVVQAFADDADDRRRADVEPDDVPLSTSHLNSFRS